MIRRGEPTFQPTFGWVCASSPPAMLNQMMIQDRAERIMAPPLDTEKQQCTQTYDTMVPLPTELPGSTRLELPSCGDCSLVACRRPRRCSFGGWHQERSMRCR